MKQGRCGEAGVGRGSREGAGEAGEGRVKQGWGG